MCYVPQSSFKKRKKKRLFSLERRAHKQWRERERIGCFGFQKEKKDVIYTTQLSLSSAQRKTTTTLLYKSGIKNEKRERKKKKKKKKKKKSDRDSTSDPYI